MRIPDSLASLVDHGILDEVLRPLMSGKEAQVFLVISNGEERVAKVYKESQNRTFKNRAEYTEGRRVRSSRDQRAMEKRSRYGRAQDEAAWRSAEVDMIYRLAAAGVRVPKPYHFIDGVLIMELVKDEEGNPAPRLGDLVFAPEQATSVFQQLITETARMLCAGVVHGDLSDFNVLMAGDGPVIIDFPQAVNASGNQNARRILVRDVANLQRFLARHTPQEQAMHYAEEMWALYERNALTPDTKLTGRYRPAHRVVTTEAVMSLVKDAEYDERKRREGLGLSMRGVPRDQQRAADARPARDPSQARGPARDQNQARGPAREQNAQVRGPQQGGRGPAPEGQRPAFDQGERPALERGQGQRPALDQRQRPVFERGQGQRPPLPRAAPQGQRREQGPIVQQRTERGGSLQDGPLIDSAHERSVERPASARSAEGAPRPDMRDSRRERVAEERPAGHGARADNQPRNQSFGSHTQARGPVPGSQGAHAEGRGPEREPRREVSEQDQRRFRQQDPRSRIGDQPREQQPYNREQPREQQPYNRDQPRDRSQGTARTDQQRERPFAARASEGAPRSTYVERPAHDAPRAQRQPLDAGAQPPAEMSGDAGEKKRRRRRRRGKKPADASNKPSPQ